MPRKKNNIQTPWMMIGAGVGTAAGVGYLAYEKIQNRKALQVTNSPDNTPNSDRSDNTSAYLPTPPTTIAFPLIPGDKNTYVQKMQQALLALGGKAAKLIQDAGGADGILGEGTREAIFEAGYKNRYYAAFTGGLQVDYQTYHQILQDAEGSQSLGSISPQTPRRLVKTIQDTHLLDRNLINQEIPRSYPALANHIIGILTHEGPELTQVYNTEKKKILYANSNHITII